MSVFDNPLKRRSRAGQPSVGLWLQSLDAAFAEMSSLMGYDFVVIDHEHGPGSITDGIAHLRATQAGGATTTPVVRVPAADPVYLKRIIDAGARGVLIPMIDTAEQARAAVAACRYPPRGIRGNAALAVRASGYGLREGYVGQADESLMIILQLESRAALQNAEAIAAVDGVDMLFVGPVDLAADLGSPHAGELDGLIDDCLARMRARGMSMGTTPRAGRSAAQLLEQGFALVTLGSDISFFRAGAQAALQQHRARAMSPSAPTGTY